MDKIIYLSGKITGNKYYKRDFKKAERKLKRTGYKYIINPTKIKLPKIATYNDYIRVDLALLDCCDTIYMLKGWENSYGAKVELAHAKFKKINIIYER